MLLKVVLVVLSLAVTCTQSRGSPGRTGEYDPPSSPSPSRNAAVIGAVGLVVGLVLVGVMVWIYLSEKKRNRGTMYPTTFFEPRYVNTHVTVSRLIRPTTDEDGVHFDYKTVKYTVNTSDHGDELLQPPFQVGDNGVANATTDKENTVLITSSGLTGFHVFLKSGRPVLIIDDANQRQIFPGARRAVEYGLLFIRDPPEGAQYRMVQVMNEGQFRTLLNIKVATGASVTKTQGNYNIRVWVHEDKKEA